MKKELKKSGVCLVGVLVLATGSFASTPTSTTMDLINALQPASGQYVGVGSDGKACQVYISAAIQEGASEEIVRISQISPPGCMGTQCDPEIVESDIYENPSTPFAVFQMIALNQSSNQLTAQWSEEFPDLTPPHDKLFFQLDLNFSAGKPSSVRLSMTADFNNGEKPVDYTCSNLE